jgi:cytochrome c-type biogenesis protein CcmH/NrfG
MEPDIGQQILAELQLLRRFSKRALITFLVLFAIFVLGAFWQLPSREGVYTEANRAIRALDYRRAIELAEKVAAEHPYDYTVLDYLGNVYLRSGDLAKAEEAYSRSNALYPSEDTGKTLESIRKSRSALLSPASVSPTGTPNAQPTPKP